MRSRLTRRFLFVSVVLGMALAQQPSSAALPWWSYHGHLCTLPDGRSGGCQQFSEGQEFCCFRMPPFADARCNPPYGYRQPPH